MPFATATASNAGSTTATATETTQPSAVRPHHVHTTSRELTTSTIWRAGVGCMITTILEA